jgi:hypothetical protein
MKNQILLMNMPTLQEIQYCCNASLHFISDAIKLFEDETIDERSYVLAVVPPYFKSFQRFK